MISVEEARTLIDKEVIDYGVVERPLALSLSHILREDLHTDRALPPYDRVTMDGIAINYDGSMAEGLLRLPIEGVSAAGSPQMSLKASSSCIEAMTGAMLPKGTDTVIRYEDLKIENDHAEIMIDTISKGQNIHYKGEDRSQGELTIKSGTQLTEAEIGVAASCGHHTLKVCKIPSCVIVSTGDELVNIDIQPKPYQIRRSNVYMIQASLQRYKVDCDLSHINDDYPTLLSVVKDHLDSYDFIILSGGVSMGKFDYLPKVLQELGVTQIFHKIKQRPGKPFWFGKSCNGKLVFALPGNPVSSFMCTHNYILPWLKSCLRLSESPQEYAVLQKDISFKPDLTYYPIVKLMHSKSGVLKAVPVNNNGSGDFASLTEGDAFLELLRGQDEYRANEAYQVIRYR